ncbi:MAG TPA: hypothetical protein VFO35_12975 [Steroidobacteraceae bacterium]|nr:hypothetical protein [Steroidobacteraceae bacterium]
MSPISLVARDRARGRVHRPVAGAELAQHYRGMLPDEDLDRHVVDDRLAYWPARLARFASDRTLVLKAVGDAKLP